jgi:hypothetical protein
MANLGRVRLMARTITKFLRNLKRHFSGLFTADISDKLKSRYMKEENLIIYVKVESADKHDSNALIPAIDEMEECGVKPEEMLADAAY